LIIHGTVLIAANRLELLSELYYFGLLALLMLLLLLLRGYPGLFFLAAKHALLAQEIVFLVREEVIRWVSRDDFIEWSTKLDCGESTL